MVKFGLCGPIYILQTPIGGSHPVPCLSTQIAERQGTAMYYRPPGFEMAKPICWQCGCDQCAFEGRTWANFSERSSLKSSASPTTSNHQRIIFKREQICVTFFLRPNFPISKNPIILLIVILFNSFHKIIKRIFMLIKVIVLHLEMVRQYSFNSGTFFLQKRDFLAIITYFQRIPLICALLMKN